MTLATPILNSDEVRSRIQQVFQPAAHKIQELPDIGKNPFRPFSLTDLAKMDIPDINYVVDGLIATGGLYLLSAREKGGKGLISIDLLISVASGETFLGRVVSEGPTIYVAAEEHARDVLARVRNRWQSPMTDIPFYVLFVNGLTEDRLSLQDPFLFARLRDMIHEIEPSLVVLDTLRELHTLKEDSADDMAPLLKPLRELAHNTDTAIVLNHHQNKGGGFRGSTAIRASCDAELAFTRDEDDSEMPRGTLRYDGRYGPRVTIPIRFTNAGRWEETSMVAIAPDDSVRGRILSFLREADSWVTADQIAAGTGAVLKTTQNEISRLLKEDPSPIVANGRAVKGSPRKFTLPQLALDLAEDRSPESFPIPDVHRVWERGNDVLSTPDSSGNDGNDDEWEEV